MRKNFMMDSPSYGAAGSAGSGGTHVLFAQTMGYVSVTAGFFALGSYIGRNLSGGWAFAWFMPPSPA